MDDARILSDLFASQRLAVLAAARNGVPHASLVTFAATGDLQALVFATGRDTGKFTGILAEPHVSLLVDNRTDAPEDLAGALAVTATGTAGEAPEALRGSYRALLLDRDPRLREFLAGPGVTVIRVEVERYILVRGIGDVRTWIPG